MYTEQYNMYKLYVFIHIILKYCVRNLKQKLIQLLNIFNTLRIPSYYDQVNFEKPK